MDCEGFLQTLNLMMSVACNSYVYTLMKGIRGGSIRDFTPALRYWPFLMVDVLVSVYGFFLHYT